MAKKDISKNIIDDDNIDKVAGGANKVGGRVRNYRFWCTLCGHTWYKRTAHPEDVHGCPNPTCKWWFESQKDNGNWDKECIKYTDA